MINGGTIRILLFLVIAPVIGSFNAQAAIIDFSGQLDFILLDEGGGVYSGAPPGTDFYGSIDDTDANGYLSDGTTSTFFGCCIAAGGLTVSNDAILSEADADFLNAVLGVPRYTAGDRIDSVNIEGDKITSSGSRIEIGLTYVFDSSTFPNDDPSNYPFNPDDTDVALFFIFEENAAGQDIYSAGGRIDPVPDARTIIAGTEFKHNAFVDVLISSNPVTSIPFVYPIDPSLYVSTFGIVGDAANIEDAVIGDDISTAAGNWAEDGYLALGFADNLLINGDGCDLALFELGSSIDSFGVSLEANGQVIEYASAFTGYYTRSSGINAMVPINVAFVDLDDFGIPAGFVIDHFYIGGLDTLTTLSVAGAINSTSIGDGDLDLDIDGQDLHAFVIAYSNTVYPTADLNGDGIVDSDDVAYFARVFGM
jgi:hypothetical protein